MKTKIIIGILITIAFVAISYAGSLHHEQAPRIGIITPLSGSSAYWGESTLVGVRLAEKELERNHIPVSFITEDGQLDPKIALNAAQKLVNVDGVEAIYSEFNPAAIPVSSFLKGKNVFHLYDSAATSPLDNGPYNLKTYLDYEDSCRETAQYVKNVRKIARIGVLKMNIEHGDLCLKGIDEVYGTSTPVESYDIGTMDFRIALTKLKQANVQAIFHASFQPETLISLREMHDLNFNPLFIGLTETITPDVTREFGPLIENDIFFGLPPISSDLMEKIKNANGGKDVANYNASALAYIHLTQLGKALASCTSDMDCIATSMNQSPPVPEIGFEGFNDRIAKFKTSIVEWRKEGFQAIQ